MSVAEASAWPVMQDGQGSSEEWPSSCSRRDANLFLRGVKRFGTIDRLPDIAAEIGPSFDNVSDAARWVFNPSCSKYALQTGIKAGVTIGTEGTACIIIRLHHNAETYVPATSLHAPCLCWKACFIVIIVITVGTISV